MFGTLLESRAMRQRRAGGSIASILIHTAIISGGVIVTGRGIIVDAPLDTRMHAVTLDPPKAPPPPRPTTVSSASAPVDAPPSPFVLRVPDIVPVGIPPVDLGAPTTPVILEGRRVSSFAGFCERDCAPRVSDAGGNQIWTGNDVMMRLRDDPIPPRYPESLRRAGVEGTVVVKFAVDTTGRVDMRSVEVVRSTHEAFTSAVRESLEKLRFNPSVVGERRVRALAIMPFQFALK